MGFWQKTIRVLVPVGDAGDFKLRQAGPADRDENPGLVRFEIVLKKAAASGETAPSLLRRIVMEALTGKHEANSKSESETLEHGLDFLRLRLAKIERIQRTLVLNTAYARGHAIGVLRSSPPEAKKIIEKEMTENFREQKKFFFELFPDQKEDEK